jgi:formyltetrahydrofolate-dependent phosphoribosylglycinamide formyltransferase
MFQRLQQKWKVNGLQLLLILCTFAIGGSLTGLAGKRIMNLLPIEKGVLWIILYIVLITLLWPMAVLLVSVFFGQFRFFTSYLRKMGRRMGIGPKKMKGSASAKQVAIFASGAGSNAQKIIDYFRGSSSVHIALIVCNKPEAGVLDIARKEGIPVLLIEKERFFRGDAYLPEFKKAGITFIILAGFLWKVPSALIQAFPDQIINIHPALLPLYGGKGMYGHHVHAAVIAAGDKESGITIHYVNERYDEGATIFQARCPVQPGDTPDVLAQRIHALEHAHYPKVIEDILKNKV